jgi:hypothetical protein
MIKFQFSSNCLIFLLLLLVGCKSENDPIINEGDFILVYAKLTIINELNINKEHHDRLISELLYEFNIQVPDIQKSVEFYQKNPRQWLTILEKVKEEIINLRRKEKAKTRSEVMEKKKIP